MHSPKIRAVSTLFRFSALIARFLLVFLLAAHLPPADVGMYGLIAATASYAVYVLGMDLYTYTTRELISSDASTWRTKLASHTALLSVITVAAIALLVYTGATGVVPWTTLFWLGGISITEQWALDIDRSLIALSHQLWASVIILIRQASMPLCVAVAFTTAGPARTLSFVFGSWIAFNLVAIVVGGFLLKRATPAAKFHIDWRWARHGLVVALPFLIGTLLLRLLFTADRQIVAYIDGLGALAAYTLATTISGGLSSIVAVGVMQFSYPALVSAASQHASAEFRRTLRSITAQTTAIIAMAITAATTLHQWIASWFFDSVYQELSWAIPFSMIAISIYNASLIPHYALYALRKDRAILQATAVSVVIFALSTIVLLSLGEHAVFTVITGVLCASISLLIIKGAAFVGFYRTWGWKPEASL